MREALNKLGLMDSMLPSISDFLHDYIRIQEMDTLISELRTLSDEGDDAIDYDRDDDSGFIQGTSIFTVMFLDAMKMKNKYEKDKPEHIWSNGVNILEYGQGDIFSYGFGNRSKTRKNIIVIPVETSFETSISWKMDEVSFPLVSINTLHGQWLNRWKQTGGSTESLNDHIRTSLQNRNVKMTSYHNGKFKVPIGTVVEVDTENARYYLLAIADFDEENHAHAEEKQIRTAVASLMSYYDIHGQGDRMIVPLMGTGRSRVGLSYKESFDLIQSTMLANKHLIQGKVLIIATPEAYEQINIGGEMD